MIVEEGDKILACYRRLHVGEEPRFFAGKVIASSDTVIKVRGFSFVRNANTAHITRKDEDRTMFISVVSGTHLLYQLPDSVSVEELHFNHDKGHLTLGDYAEFEMNITELQRSKLDLTLTKV